MTTASEEIAARKAKYSRTEYYTDELGRNIGVQKLKPSQQTRVVELTAQLDGVEEIVDEDETSPTFGKVFRQSKRTPMIMAASVREIDGIHIPFPKSRQELDALLDRLDQEGLTAVGMALMQFNPPKAENRNPDGSPETPAQADQRVEAEVKSTAKN